MIFTSVFGFANSPSAYYLMGYSAIPFYIFSALLFFIPFALMMAEMGAAYRKEEGGIYSWMNNSVGPRFAFIGTFMWFSSYIIWMVSTSAKVWVPFSTFLYGSDMTQHWRIAGLEPTQVVGLLAVAWMILVTVVASKGINKIARITAVGGIAVMCLNLVLLLVSITILLLNGGHFAQDINFLASPNPGYQSGLAMLSFVVFAIFAYGGIEAVGGLVDKTENPEKNFAKGIVFAAIVISIGYSLAIFLWGVSTNWQQVLSNGSVNLGNITYVLMKSLGVTLGNALHLSPEASLSLGVWFARSTLQILLVNHINHANEVDETFRQAMAKLRRVGVTLLNQSVLLRGVNDNAQTLANLSNALFDAGVMPYYLHVLDKVQGAAHFMVSDDEARQIMRELLTLVSGYLVPKLAREIGGEPSKTPLDLQLRQQ